MDIAVIGSNMVDLISYITRMPTEGETIEAPDFALGCGGKGANQAVAASRLGSEVLMVTRVGDDLFAANTVANFEANGIDTTFVLPTPGTSGVAPIFVDEQSRNSIIIVKGANAALTPADLEAAEAEIARCRLIVVQLEIPIETVHAAIDLAARLDVPVLLNPAPATHGLDYERVAQCEYFVPNETELATLTGMPAGTTNEITAAAAALIEKGCRNVIVTLGSRGVLWVSPDGEVLIPQDNAVEALDSTGAGDAFIGCFAHEVTHGATVRDALVAANAYAANSVTKRGTQTSYATREDFDAWRRP